MAHETKRGCGYRKVGGLYLVGNYIAVECDRLPYALHSCPVCGAGIHFTRSMTEINPLNLFGTHDEQVPVFQDNPEVAGYVTKVNCYDTYRPCFMCDPTGEPAFIMMVGEKHYPTPEHFMEEARTQGISKRIPFKPRKLELGKTILYLAHNKACIVKEPVAVQQALEILGDKTEPPKLLDDGQKHHLGIFSAFIPQKIEKLCWQSEYTDENIAKHKKQGIDLIPVPDGDKDHK